MEEALISINNPNTKGLPILNGPTPSYFVVYPTGGIPQLPSTFLGTAASRIDFCFFFASVAVPAQANFEEASSSHIGVADSVLFYTNKHPNLILAWDDERKKAAKARRENAVQAVNLFLGTYTSFFGPNRNYLKQSQIITFGRENPINDNETETASSLTWISTVLDLSQHDDQAMKNLLIPFCMGQDVDEVDSELEGYPDEEDDEASRLKTYHGFVFRLLSVTDSFFGQNNHLAGFHRDFTGVLRSLFISGDREHTWIVKATTASSIRRYNDIVDGLTRIPRDESSLFWFERLLLDYIVKNGRSWSDIWQGNRQGASAENFSHPPSVLIEEPEWQEHFANSPDVRAIISHIRRNGLVTRSFLTVTHHLYRELTAPRRTIPMTQAIADFAAPTTRNVLRRFSINPRMVENLAVRPFPLLASAAYITPTAWRNRKPFINDSELLGWVQGNESLRDMTLNRPIAASDLTSWPLWFLILQHQTNGSDYTNHDLIRRAENVLEILRRHGDKAVQSPEALQNLRVIRRSWLAANHRGQRLDIRGAMKQLDSFLRNYNKLPS